ncbi:unnamed protein product [Linum trigynum]|uniref:Uncharacterized protein n=1 Tax=Linum trigynum TaxID=586398 RepID=A0AAV2DUA8_9ROSI
MGNLEITKISAVCWRNSTKIPDQIDRRRPRLGGAVACGIMFCSGLLGNPLRTRRFDREQDSDDDDDARRRAHDGR